jgi:O-antigen/teichoic acid export membrane protein
VKTSHWPLTVLNTVVSFVQLFLPLLLVRIFSQDAVGSYKIFFLYLNILPLITFSAGFVHGLYFWTGNKERGRELVRQVWTILTSYSLFLAFVGITFAGYFSHLFHCSYQLVVYFSLAGASSLIFSFYEEAWVAAGRVWQSALMKSGFEVARAGLIALVAFKTRDIESVLLTYTLVNVTKFVVETFIGIRQNIARPIFDSKLSKEAMNYALPVSTAGFLSAASGSTDSILLSTLLSRAEFAVYSLGCLSVPPLLALEQSVNQVLASRLSRHIAAGDKALAEREFSNTVLELARYLIPSFIGLQIFAEPIITLLFTTRYLDSVPVLRMYALSYLLMIIPYDGGPRASGSGGWALKVFILKTIVSISVVAVMTTILSTYGLGKFGAMSGVLASGLFLRFAGIRFNITRLGWTLSEFIPKAELAHITIISALLGAPCLLIKGYFANSLIWFAVAGGGFSLLYGWLILLPSFRSRRG